jgi:hypothetical protein
VATTTVDLACKTPCRIAPPSEAEPRFAAMVTFGGRILGRALDGLDLLIDLATLGEYGLEAAPASGAGGEGAGRMTGREVLAPASRRGPERSRGGHSRAPEPHPDEEHRELLSA